MPRARIPVMAVNQICMEPRPKGLTAVYLVETQNEQEAVDLERLFQDFAPALESVQLTKGKLVSYAVQLHSHDQSLLEEIEAFLKKSYGFVMLHRSFEPLIYDIVRELARESGSELMTIPKCDICGRPDPFPETTVSLLDKSNVNITTRTYCTACTAESSTRSNKEFLMSLLAADRGDLAVLSHMRFVRSRSTRKRLAFRVKSDTEQQFAVT